MKLIDLTIPLGIATPPWPTYEPLQVKYFKRLAPNGANGQLVTHSNHLGTHLDGEIHFFHPRQQTSQPGIKTNSGGAGAVDGFIRRGGRLPDFTPRKWSRSGRSARR